MCLSDCDEQHADALADVVHVQRCGVTAARCECDLTHCVFHSNDKRLLCARHRWCCPSIMCVRGANRLRLILSQVLRQSANAAFLDLCRQQLRRCAGRSHDAIDARLVLPPIARALFATAHDGTGAMFLAAVDARLAPCAAVIAPTTIVMPAVATTSAVSQAGDAAVHADQQAANDDERAWAMFDADGDDDSGDSNVDDHNARTDSQSKSTSLLDDIDVSAMLSDNNED
jgi:hypothetical protein